MILASAEIPFRHHGLYSYRIEIDLTDPGNIRQRRIWTPEDGQARIEGWIRLGGVSAQGLAERGFRPAGPRGEPS
jgi:hypothetical protein